MSLVEATWRDVELAADESNGKWWGQEFVWWGFFGQLFSATVLDKSL